MTTEAPPNARFIVQATWLTVRDQFTQEERDAMNAAVISEVICPRGGVVDLSKLDPQLREKLERVLPLKGKSAGKTAPRRTR